MNNWGLMVGPFQTNKGGTMWAEIEPAPKRNWRPLPGRMRCGGMRFIPKTLGMIALRRGRTWIVGQVERSHSARRCGWPETLRIISPTGIKTWRKADAFSQADHSVV